MHAISQRIISLCFCILLSITVVMILFRFSENANHRSNDFIRLYPPHFLYHPRQINLPYNSFYLAGCTRKTIYLGNSTAAGFVFWADNELNDTGHIILKVPSDLKIVGDAARAFVDSPDIYLMEGLSPKILHGVVENSLMSPVRYHDLNFNAYSIISKQSFVFRTYDWQKKENMLAKANFSGQATIFPSLLAKKGDGVFSLDGQIVNDRSAHKLAYLYYYRNEFLSLDTNLAILVRGHTIDSISTPQIKLSRILSSGTTTFSSPPLLVNKTAYADSNFLFVNSKLRAKNEYDDLEYNAVIDIYSLKNGEYVYSFYIPGHNKEKLKGFQVFNHQLMILFDQTLMAYSMHF